MADSFIGWHRIEDAQGSPYMTRIWFGRLRLHIFYRGDNDPDPHDHPWDFWTFPLVPYAEEVLTPGVAVQARNGKTLPPVKHTTTQVVSAFRLHKRPAEHAHRVLSAVEKVPFGYLPRTYLEGPQGRFYRYVNKRIITLVWRGPNRNRWGFFKRSGDMFCWTFWKDYLFWGGKHAPCQDDPAYVMSVEQRKVLNRVERTEFILPEDAVTCPGLHFCPDWDYMAVFDGSPEKDCCTCNPTPYGLPGKRSQAIDNTTT